jgi:hypothetical protein
MTNAQGSKSARNPKTAPTLVETRCAEPGCPETTTMPFRRAARGTHRCPAHSKPTTPAEGGAPEVAIDASTTAVLANPADAPPPPPKRPARSKKSAPTVAEVPDWAKRAAARNTATEMAAVPEVAPVAEPPATKKGRAQKAKAKPVAKETPAAKPGSLRAIGTAWIDSLRADGHSVSTVTSYGNDLELAYEHLDGDRAAAGLTERQIAGFNASALVMKKRSGKPRAMPTILKTRRVLRLALVWAEQKKLIAKAPYAAKTSA